MPFFPKRKVELPRLESEFPQDFAREAAESSEYFKAFSALRRPLAAVFDAFALFFPAAGRSAFCAQVLS